MAHVDDEDLLRHLEAITGDSETWRGFDPSAWRALQAEAAESRAGESADDAMAQPQEGAVDYSSDDSAPMIFNYHKLTRAEREQASGCKLSKARQFASEEVGFPDEVAKLEKVKWEETDLAKGDVSAEGALFVPWDLVEKYPDTFVGKVNGARAAPLFTLDALHENRVWDLFYIHCPPDMNMKHVIFVPTYQFEHLLDVVNAKLETQLTIPPGKNAERFKMSFGIGNSPRPRFLGRSDSPETFKTLCKAIPAPHPDDDLSKATQLGLEEFRDLLKSTRGGDRKRGKRQGRNHSKRVKAHRAWGRSIKRAQRYLGLRGRVSPKVADKSVVLDLSQPMVDAPEGSVLFIAIDIEAWEQDNNLITELGIAMLDTTEIQGIAPGAGGQNWFKHIHARHIRVKENSWAENSRYVRGCADSFNFGTSEFLQESLLNPLLNEIINDATFTDPTDDGSSTPEPRPVVLVFHESASDVKYLKLLSYYVEGAHNVVEVLDTREMHQVLARSNDSAKLANVLGSLGISYRNLHNAGNDAVYTLQAMVALAVKKRVMSLEREGKEEGKGKGKKVEGSGSDSDDDNKQKNGWTSGEDTDGGDPLCLYDITMDPSWLAVAAEADDAWGDAVPGSADEDADDGWGKEDAEQD